MPNKNQLQLHTKVVQHTNGRKPSIIPVPVRKNVSNSKVKLSPTSKMSQGSSQTMDREIKKIDSVYNQKEQSLIPLHLKISKELTITHVNDTKNNIISKLKKLPEITVDLIKPEPVFKVPESPKPKTKNIKKYTIPSNVLKDKGATHNIKLNSNTNLNSSAVLKQKQILNKTSLITKSSDNKGISKKPETSIKIHSVLGKENLQRTSSPKMLSKIIQSSPMIKSKSLKTNKPVEVISNNCKIVTEEEKPVEKVSNNPVNTLSKEVKKKSDKNTFINNTELKTNKLANENYMLMDLSTDGELNIVPASFILDFNNVNDPEYRQFLMGINKSHLDSNMDMESSQNVTKKELSIIIEESDTFSDFIKCINTSLNINESNDIDSELESLSSNNKNSSLGITFEQLHKSKENIMKNIEDKQNFYFDNHTSKQPLLQHNDMNRSMDMLIKQEDNQLFRKMTSYYCGDNLIENIPENEKKLIAFNTSKQPNSINDSTYLKSDENSNKRKQFQNQNELYKKQRMEVLEEF
ncbi:rho GTPase-activating protein gacZ-like isoform X1 [Aphis gossypii]|uniref:rho GTPase-activating protein gacZ-like isoform X1 n=1 Tax=Aphis gossypii TaxID=80765 RepID=UPI0021595649|nr:rho GTPase-activating protein gacZ-like isoform X1 [Aphis gossypii]XP_050054913.1 rho GTPase-activating protein gacZ-like isoform X1 [Aphis gossypii]